MLFYIILLLKISNFQPARHQLSPQATAGGSNSNDQISKIEKIVQEKAKKYNCVVLLKGSIDIVSNGEETVRISGGNAGMTKGGTGDVLAGLVAALYCKNDAFLAACAGSYINKKTGEKLAEKMGLYFNASDLADEIPKVMKNL